MSATGPTTPGDNGHPRPAYHPEGCTCDACLFDDTPYRPAPLADPDPSAPEPVQTQAWMDRPAYELVRLIEAELDDGDQVTDTPQRPNVYTIWGIRALLEPYGGRPHRWQWPHCFECGHQSPLHNYGPCALCGCALTPEEVVAGARDEALDDDILRALQQDQENRDD